MKLNWEFFQLLNSLVNLNDIVIIFLLEVMLHLVLNPADPALLLLLLLSLSTIDM